MGALSAQLSFDDFAGPLALTDRYFFALYPPLDVASGVGQIALEQRKGRGLQGKPLLTDRFHVTLLHLGDYAEERPDIVSAAQAVAENLRADAFDICFDRVASFARKAAKAPLVLQGSEGVHDVIAFQQKLANAMKRSSLHRLAKGSFTPHMTLLYDDQTVAEEPVQPVGWNVREFVLVRSLIGKTQHIVLGRWALGSQP